MVKTRSLYLTWSWNATMSSGCDRHQDTETELP